MKRSAIRAIIRGLIDDPVKAAGDSEDDSRCLWKNAELNGYIQEAVDIIASRCLLITDSMTDEVCQITMDSAKQHYLLDPRVLKIEEILPSWSDTPLVLTSRNQVERGWLKATGQPERYLTDYSTGYLSMDRKPSSDTDTIRMTVKRLPLEDLANDNAEPEFSKTYHFRTYNWILYRCYSKQDAEIFNGVKAEYYRQLFEGLLVGGTGGDIGAILIEENLKRPIVRDSQRRRDV